MWLSLAHLAGVIFLQPRSDPFAIAGIVMYTAAVAVFLAAIEAAEAHAAAAHVVDQPLPDRLITDGPYRWVRHPFYLGYLIGALAPVVAIDSLLMPLLSTTVVVITVFAAFREERVWLASTRAEAVSGVPPSHRDVSSVPWPRVTRYQRSHHSTLEPLNP